MIIQRDIPFERMARFLHDNVCEPPPVKDADLREGLGQFAELLRAIYSDPCSFDGRGDKASWEELLFTVLLLLGCAEAGQVRHDCDGCWRLYVDKAELHKVYRKGSIARRIDSLTQYGIVTLYDRKGTLATTLGRATSLTLLCPGYPQLIPALKRFVDLGHRTLDGQRSVIYGLPGAFITADYATAAGLSSARRTDLDPLRPGILRTVGQYEPEWRRLVTAMRDENGWRASGFMHYGFSPSWGVSFQAGRRRPTAIFTLCSDRVFVEFTLPLSTVETIIRQRHELAPSIREKIEALCCVNCPKACGGDNLIEIDRVTVCSGRAEARRIYATLSEANEFESILELVAIAKHGG